MEWYNGKQETVQRHTQLVHHAESTARRSSDLHKAEPHAPGIAACAPSAPDSSLHADGGRGGCHTGACWGRRVRGHGAVGIRGRRGWPS